jgi:pimeloyl-ACP methyl ester carboxylesterase
LPTPKTRNRITFAALQAIRTPTLLLTGDADLYLPPPVMELFQKIIAGSRALVIAGCGHSAFWEQPETFNRAVLDFIRGQSPN